MVKWVLIFQRYGTFATAGGDGKYLFWDKVIIWNQSDISRVRLS